MEIDIRPRKESPSLKCDAANPHNYDTIPFSPSSFLFLSFSRSVDLDKRTFSELLFMHFPQSSVNLLV